MATANVGPSFQSCRFQAPDQKWHARFICNVALYSLSRPFFCLSFLFLHDTVLALFTREAVRRQRRARFCGKMLPDNTGVCDSKSQLIPSGTKGEYKTIHFKTRLTTVLSSCRLNASLFLFMSFYYKTGRPTNGNSRAFTFRSPSIIITGLF